MKRALRVAAVIGVIAGASFFGSASDASHQVAFAECGEPAQGPTGPTGVPSGPSGVPTPSPTPEPTPTSIPEDCTPPSGERITGKRDVRFAVTSGPERITFAGMWILANEKAVKSANGGKPVLQHAYPCDEGPRPIQVYDYKWDSVKTTPLNGKYLVRALVAASLGCGAPHEMVDEVTDLRVDNPPLAVGAPEIVATTTESVTIKWPTAKEADVQSYTVYRAVTKDATKAPSTKDLKAIDVVTASEYRDTKVGGDVNWYAVRVTRRSIVTPEEGISSPLSKLSGGANVRDALAPVQPSGRRSIPRRQLSTVRGGRPPPVPDAPYSAYLPYENAPDSSSVETDEPGGDPRGPVLPVAVGAFLVSSALALGRMPY